MNNQILEYTKRVIESLGGIPNINDPNLFLLKNNLVIRHSKSKIEYTIEKIDLSDKNNPKLFVYRYTPSGDKKYVEIEKNNFKDYENI